MVMVAVLVLCSALLTLVKVEGAQEEPTTRKESALECIGAGTWCLVGWAQGTSPCLALRGAHVWLWFWGG